MKMDLFHLLSNHPIIVSLINDASVLWILINYWMIREWILKKKKEKAKNNSLQYYFAVMLQGTCGS